VLTVGTDGRVRSCRIHKPSPDAEADAITCRLARERFRFRPATDRAGNPIESEFGWQQRWFAP
jgi:protein TonB